MAKRATAGEALLSIDGAVYDVGQFSDDHPGGSRMVRALGPSPGFRLPITTDLRARPPPYAVYRQSVFWTEDPMRPIAVPPPPWRPALDAITAPTNRTW